jgi:hypothetical protein
VIGSLGDGQIRIRLLYVGRGGDDRVDRVGRVVRRTFELHRNEHGLAVLGPDRRTDGLDRGQCGQLLPEFGDGRGRRGLAQRAVGVGDEDGFGGAVAEAGLLDQLRGLAGLADPVVPALRVLFRDDHRHPDGYDDEQQPEADRPPWMDSTPARDAHSH